MLKENCIMMWFSCYKTNIKNHQVCVQMVPSPPYWKFFRKLSTHSTSLCKLMTVSKYGKLQMMADSNWIMYGISFFVKILLQSIFICPINLPKFFQFPNSTCAGCSVRLYEPVNCLFLSLRRIWLFFNLCHFLTLFKCIYCLMYLHVKLQMLSVI